MGIIANIKPSLPPAPLSPKAHTPSKRTLLELAAVLAFTLVLHLSFAKPAIGLFALLIWGVKVLLIYKNLNNLSKTISVLLTVTSVIMIIVFYGGWNSQQAGISFLILLVSLKFLESHSLRDYYVVCIILLFIASVSFLIASSAFNIIIVLAYTGIIIGLLIKLTDPLPIRWAESNKTTFSILVKALPLAMLLFFLFPRIQADFGFIPSQDENGSPEKLTDSLVAGDFASSAFSNALAFRAEFTQKIPPRNQLYWRVKVMPNENQFTWSLQTPDRRRLMQGKQGMLTGVNNNKSDLYTYQIMHEPSQDSFAPFLDYVLEQNLGRELEDRSIFIPVKKSTSFNYQGTSIARASIIQATQASLSPQTRARLTKTISVPSKRVQTLLNNFKTQAKTPQELVEIVYQHFVTNNFRYSLAPPNLGDDPVDDFLFETQTGYCEHYASVFSIIMRWLDVPARVVVGFQGGKINPQGNYLEVRYSDAHAWSEVWINQRWQRVDPTAAISPERIDFGMQALLELWQDQPFSNGINRMALNNLLNPTGVNKLYRELRNTWSNIDYQWDKWVSNYSFDKQRQLLSTLGLAKENSLYTLTALLGSSIILLLSFYFWQSLPKAVKKDPVEKIYLDFIAAFKHKKNDSLTLTMGRTATEFAQLSSQELPQHKNEIDRITQHYLSLRYGLAKNRHNPNLELFKQQVKAFKLSVKRN